MFRQIDSGRLSAVSYLKCHIKAQQTTLQLSARWPGHWMVERLEVTLFWYRPLCFCCANQVFIMLLGAFTWQSRGLYQSKVTSSLAAIQRPGHRADNCKGAFVWDQSGIRIIDHFTVVGLVTWPLNGRKAGVDLVLVQTSLLLLCKSSCSYAN